jgi:uncharacterized membrane protein YfcA
MHTDLPFYAVAIPAVMILGLAKGGFSGLGVLAVPLMALVISPVEAASITLPILMVQDVVSVWVFRHSWDGRSVATLLPGALVGVGLGYLLAAHVSVSAVELAVGLTAIVFGTQQVWKHWQPLAPAKGASTLKGAVCGVASGFTSQIAHAGGLPFQIYMLPKRLPHEVFIGTSSIYFAAVNWIKVPAYFALGQFTRMTLTTAAVLLPLAIAATLAGAFITRRISGRRFYLVVYLLLIAVGIKLISDGARTFIGAP